MTERPETITLAGVELRWDTELSQYGRGERDARVAFFAFGEWHALLQATPHTGVHAVATDLDSLDAAVRAELVAVRDACAAIVGPGVDVEAIRAEERERCAAVADDLGRGHDAGDDPYGDGCSDTARKIAKAIRALATAVRT